MRRHSIVVAVVVWNGLCPFLVADVIEQAEKATSSFAGQRAESIRLMRESIARQKESIRNQAPREQLRLNRDQNPPIAGRADCEPISDVDVAPMISEAAAQSNLDPALIRAVISQESAFRPCAVSARGAMGLMQLMPETAASLNLTDPYDPRQNIRCGAQYLRQMFDQFQGNEKRALAAYNAGPARVQDDSFVAMEDVQQYVERILEAWNASRNRAEIADDHAQVQ
jgi:soluble lytic murein transglycosylase-like protein